MLGEGLRLQVPVFEVPMTLKRDHTAGSESKPSTIDVVPLAFHGRRILDMTFRGRRAWLLSDVETSLEYEPNGLGSSIRREWAARVQGGPALRRGARRRSARPPVRVGCHGV